MSIAIAIIGLALLIVLHEAGHFLAARLCGMRVERFSIGFGNALVSFKRGDTVYQIAPIPLGGFVQVTGMNPQEEFDHDDPYVYPNRPRWMRFLVLVAGPAANYLTAMVIGFVVLVTYGQYTGTTTVDEIVQGSAAQAVGLLPGDVVAGVGGKRTGGLLPEAQGRPVRPVRVVRAKAVGHAFGLDPSGLRVEERELEGRAAGVENEDHGRHQFTVATVAAVSATVAQSAMRDA